MTTCRRRVSWCGRCPRSAARRSRARNRGSRSDGGRAVGWRAWTAVAAAAAVTATAIGAGHFFRPDRAIRVATGLVAHNVCSKVLVSGLDPETVFAETTERADIRRLRPLLKFHFDRGAKFIDASLAG